MIGPRRRLAARAIAITLTVAIGGACVPTPVGRATASPAANAGPAAAPAETPTPAPTGPTPPPSFVRPTPTPLPTFLSYVVKAGDTLTSIARAHGTTARSLAFWNRTSYPSLDPDSPSYDPNRIAIGWVLLLVPDVEIEEDETFPE
jgi:nucleoid-associated protein YgaU